MSFAVWQSRPPFAEQDLNPGEKIYRIGDVWVVTDQGEPTPEQIDAVLNPPALTMTATQKLEAFLAANPDVVALVTPRSGG
jgi:hypothetical protein